MLTEARAEAVAYNVRKWIAKGGIARARKTWQLWCKASGYSKPEIRQIKAALLTVCFNSRAPLPTLVKESRAPLTYRGETDKFPNDPVAFFIDMVKRKYPWLWRMYKDDVRNEAYLLSLSVAKPSFGTIGAAVVAMKNSYTNCALSDRRSK